MKMFASQPYLGWTVAENVLGSFDVFFAKFPHPKVNANEAKMTPAEQTGLSLSQAISNLFSYTENLVLFGHSIGTRFHKRRDVFKLLLHTRVTKKE